MNSTKTNVLAGFVIALLLAAVYLGIHAGAAFSHATHTYPWNPIKLLADMALHGAPWPASATVFTIIFLVIVVALFTALLSWRARRAADKRAASNTHLASSREIASFREKARRKEARRLHPTQMGMAVGLAVGVVLGTRKWIIQGWEDTAVYVFGNRQGKTSAIVTRHVQEAPGALVLTSTKPDGVKETLALRQSLGDVYLFDPNGIYRNPDAAPDFVFNPLDVVTNYQSAQDLAGIFEASTKTGEERGGDAQFDTGGRNLLACAFLAAAKDGLPLSRVWQWLSNMEGEDIQDRLTNRNLSGPAAVVAGVLASHDRTRTSTFATAHRMASALAYDELLRWTTTRSERVGRHGLDSRFRPGRVRREQRHPDSARRAGDRFCRRDPDRSRPGRLQGGREGGQLQRRPAESATRDGAGRVRQHRPLARAAVALLGRRLPRDHPQLLLPEPLSGL